MPFRKTPLQAGNFYHVYNRGNNRQNIFFDRENYLYFLRLMKLHLVGNDIDILAYCLMPNHYHFLVYLRAETLSAAMKSLSGAYTKAINKRFSRCGVLFQGRFQSILVDNTDYLMTLSRYIHLNPVKAGMVEKLEEWEFSSYLEYAGLRAGVIPQTTYFQTQFQDESVYEHFLANLDQPEHHGFKNLLLD